jgi:hypothetical protein
MQSNGVSSYEEAKREREGKPRGGSESEKASREEEARMNKLRASQLPGGSGHVNPEARKGASAALDIAAAQRLREPDNFGWMERREYSPNKCGDTK